MYLLANDAGEQIWTDSPTIVSLTTSANILVNSLTVGRGNNNVTTNTAVGRHALNSITSGGFNTAIGYDALASATSSASNVAIGYAALDALAGANNENIAVGGNALGALATGSGNTAIGSSAASAQTDGSLNVIVGAAAALFQADGSTQKTDGDNSVYLGAQCRGFNNSDSNAIVIGYQAIGEGANKTVIGNANTSGCHLFGALKIGDGTDETKTATFDCSGITTATNRTLTVQDLSGSIALMGATNAGNFTLAGNLSIEGNTTIGNASGDTVTINAGAWTLANAVTLTRTAVGSAAEFIQTWQVSDSATTVSLANSSATDERFLPAFDSVMEQGIDGTGLAFTVTKGVDSTQPAIVLLGRYNSGGGNTDLAATTPIVQIRNRATNIVSIFPASMQFIADPYNLVLGTSTGTKFGTAITQKIGFYNATPIAQRAGAAQVAVATTAATQTTPWGYSTQAQADGLVTLVNELRAWAVAQGFIKGAA